MPRTKKEVTNEVLDEVVKKPTRKRTVKKETEQLIETTLPEIKETTVEIKAEEKKNKLLEFAKKNYLIIGIITIAILLIIISSCNSKKSTNVSISSSPTTFNFSEISEQYADYQETITLPQNWCLTDTGELFDGSEKILKSKGVVSISPITREEFDSLLANPPEGYGIENIKINDYDVIKVGYQDETMVLNYFFMYKDEKLVQVILQDVDQETTDSILNSIK